MMLFTNLNSSLLLFLNVSKFKIASKLGFLSNMVTCNFELSILASLFRNGLELKIVFNSLFVIINTLIVRLKWLVIAEIIVFSITTLSFIFDLKITFPLWMYVVISV